MVSTVKTRQTHYEVLGLKPTATKDEIVKAFAREIGMFRPHSFADATDATVAFQTLRDPARRRAYDASLGLEPKRKEARPSPMSWQVGAQFLGASTMPAMQPAISRPTLTEPPAEPEATPFLAAALRDLASPEPLVETLRAKRVANTAPVILEVVREEATEKRTSDGDRRAYLAFAEGPGEADGAIPWKRTTIVAAAVVAGVALLGAWAGWDSARGAEPAENGTKAMLPPPTTYTVRDPASAAPNRVLDDTRRLPPKRIAHAASHVARARPTTRLTDLDRQLSEPSEPAPALANPTEQGSDIAPVTAAAASLPLPNAVIARTIERIGYPCGQIASTTQSGAPGVFTVTCTSGHSYQAAPVRGRYHFRRLGRG